METETIGTLKDLEFIVVYDPEPEQVATPPPCGLCTPQRQPLTRSPERPYEPWIELAGGLVSATVLAGIVALLLEILA